MNQNTSGSLLQYLQFRQIFDNVSLTKSVEERCLTSHLPVALHENEISIGEVDKIFASQWLDDVHVICGSKCNKLIVQNIQSKQQWDIPVLEGSGEIPQPEKNCGIHTISINSGRSLLATGAENPNSVAVYRLPTLEPVCVGEFHSDWLFASCWLSDSVLATGSRDKCIALWSIQDERPLEQRPPLKTRVISPMHSIDKRSSLDKIRDMVFNPFSNHIVALSSGGSIHIWDPVASDEVTSTSLPFEKENVCIAHQKDNLLYAVGSLSHVSLLETRCGQPVASFSSNDQGAGVRSVSFHDRIVTIGTGYGSVLFYDIRMNRMLRSPDGTICRHRSGLGWLKRDEVYREYFWEAECYPNAVYTHCYDPSRTKLFTAGGPLALGLCGNYAAYWR